MISTWLAQDLNQSWRKLANAIRQLQGQFAGPVIADTLLQNVGLTPGKLFYGFTVTSSTCVVCAYYIQNQFYTVACHSPSPHTKET